MWGLPEAANIKLRYIERTAVGTGPYYMVKGLEQGAPYLNIPKIINTFSPHLAHSQPLSNSRRLLRAKLLPFGASVLAVSSA